MTPCPAASLHTPRPTYSTARLAAMRRRLHAAAVARRWLVHYAAPQMLQRPKRGSSRMGKVWCAAARRRHATQHTTACPRTPNGMAACRQTTDTHARACEQGSVQHPWAIKRQWQQRPAQMQAAPHRTHTIDITCSPVNQLPVQHTLTPLKVMLCEPLGELLQNRGACMT